MTLPEAPTLDLLAAVTDGELDLALDATPLPTVLVALRDYPKTLVLVVGAEHPLATGTPLPTAAYSRKKVQPDGPNATR